MFQMLFAAICPLLMTGAFASRFRFWPWFVFTMSWELLVYYPVAHWVWGGGFLQQRGVIDFAGGIVVHVTSGTAALVTAAMLGRRKVSIVETVWTAQPIPRARLQLDVNQVTVSTSVVSTSPLSRAHDSL
jgi:ammonia channel protein AmtB